MSVETPDRLEDPVLGTLVLEPASGYVVLDVDLGWPTVREVVVERPGVDGVDDYTARHGARAVTMRVGIVPTDTITVQQARERLSAFANPTRRPTLVLAAEERRVLLRGQTVAAPLFAATSSVMQVSWLAPEGVLEGLVERQVSVGAAPVAEPGVGFPLTFPLAFPAVSVTGAATVVNGTLQGATDAAPILRLYGPATDPAIYNLTTMEGIVLNGVSLVEGQYVEVNPRTGTVRLNGRATESLLDRIDFLTTTLWYLQPGPNLVRYTPVSYEAGAYAQVIYRDTYL